MRELSEAAIAELKSQYPDVDMMNVKAPDGSRVVIRTPESSVWQQHVANSIDDRKDKTIAMNALALQCVVYPPREIMVSMLAKYPAYSSTLTNQLRQMAGQLDELDAKKL